MNNVLPEKDSPTGRHGLTNPRTVERVAEARLPTDFGEFRVADHHDRFAQYLKTKKEKMGHLIHRAR